MSLNFDGGTLILDEGTCSPLCPCKLPISGRVDTASVTETLDLGLISGGVKPKTIKIGIDNFHA